MANPIPSVHKLQATPEQQKELALNELMSNLIENAEALKQTTALLQELHASGILPALQAFVHAKEKVAAIAVHQLLRPSVTNIINNAMAVAGALSSTDPETTKKLMVSLSNGLEKAEEGLVNNQTTSVWDLMKVMNDPDINRAMTFGLNLLKGLGRGLKEKS